MWAWAMHYYLQYLDYTFPAMAVHWDIDAVLGLSVLFVCGCLSVIDTSALRSDG